MQSESRVDRLRRDQTQYAGLVLARLPVRASALAEARRERDRERSLLGDLGWPSALLPHSCQRPRTCAACDPVASIAWAISWTALLEIRGATVLMPRSVGLPPSGLVPRKIGGKEPVDLGVRHEAGQSSEAAL